MIAPTEHEIEHLTKVAVKALGRDWDVLSEPERESAKQATRVSFDIGARKLLRALRDLRQQGVSQ